MKLTKLETGYIAALIDGEGTITIAPTGKRYFAPQVIISQKDPRALKWLHTLVGGNLREGLNASACKTCGLKQPYWRWVLTGRAKVLPFLGSMLNHLKLKRAQAEVTLKLCQSLQPGGKRWPAGPKTPRGRPGRPSVLPQAVHDYRRQLYLTIKHLNQISRHSHRSWLAEGCPQQLEGVPH